MSLDVSSVQTLQIFPKGYLYNYSVHHDMLQLQTLNASVVGTGSEDTQDNIQVVVFKR